MGGSGGGGQTAQEIQQQPALQAAPPVSSTNAEVIAAQENQRVLQARKKGYASLLSSSGKPWSPAVPAGTGSFKSPGLGAAPMGGSGMNAGAKTLLGGDFSTGWTPAVPLRNRMPKGGVT